eukprot:1247420-Prymnesium_polylepis.1
MAAAAAPIAGWRPTAPPSAMARNHGRDRRALHRPLCTVAPPTGGRPTALPTCGVSARSRVAVAAPPSAAGSPAQSSCTRLSNRDPTEARARSASRPTTLPLPTSRCRSCTLDTSNCDACRPRRRQRALGDCAALMASSVPWTAFSIAEEAGPMASTRASSTRWSSSEQSEGRTIRREARAVACDVLMP